jgi:hypothetical protein
MPDCLHPLAGVTEELVGDELYLYGGESSTSVHCLNSGAALIWFLCDGTRGLAEVAEALVAGFGVPRSEIDDDVRTTVTKLQALGLLSAKDRA